MKKASITFGIALGLGVLLAATLLFTKPASLSQAFQLQLANLLLYIAAAILFLFAIKPFRPSLRGAYRFMGAGASMLLVGIIVIYSLAAVGLSDKPWTPVLVEVPFIFMAIAFYVGIQAFARLIGVQSMFTRSRLVYPISVGIGIVVAFIVGMINGQVFDVLAGIRSFNLQFFMWGMILAYQVVRLASPFYKTAFTWFAVFSGMTVLNTILGHFQEHPFVSWFVEASVITYLVTGFILSMAAWQFNRLAYAEKNGTFVHQNAGGAANSKTSVDIIIFLAGFASNPTLVDPYLDTVRNITSSVSDRKLNEGEQAKLADVYLRIEDFLINKEPLRRFNQKDLRQMIDLQFKEAVNEPAFWRKVPIT